MLLKCYAEFPLGAAEVSNLNEKAPSIIVLSSIGTAAIIWDCRVGHYVHVACVSFQVTGYRLN